MKVCTKCGIEKDFSEFHKNKSSKDLHQSWCKDCGKERVIKLKTDKKLQLEKAIRSSVILENKILAKENKKLCTNCKNIFFIDEINQNSMCNNCVKEYRDITKEKKREYNKQYRLKQKQLKANL